MVAETPQDGRTVSRHNRRAPARIDMGLFLGRRIKELMATFAERAGLDKTDPDPVLLTAIERAARLTALAEDASARAVRGDPKIGLDDVVRLSRVADLAVRRLHLDRRNTKQPGLADFLRGAP